MADPRQKSEIVPPSSGPSPANLGREERLGFPAWNAPFLSASFMTICLLGVSSAALAAPAFVAPAGVSQYRLAFITDYVYGDTDATSTVISTYNLFASSAAGTNPNLPATSWYGIVSTPTESAASNVSCGATCDATVPIFLIDGTTEVAASTDDLFANTIMNLIDEDEIGGPHGLDGYVWTGSTAAGTGEPGEQLGTSAPNTGWDFFTSDMLSTGFTYPDTSQLPIYAISGVLTAVATPEPASLVLLAFGGAATGLIRRLRRKRPFAR
jgi:hypothetical protein